MLRLEIHDRDPNQIVTILELLSPSNKQTGASRDQYRAKVMRILASGTNFVEIDLLRDGPRMTWDRLRECDYCALVSRSAERTIEPPTAALRPIRLRDPLPSIPIALRDSEPEPTLDLQAIVDRVDDAADYQLFIYAAS